MDSKVAADENIYKWLTDDLKKEVKKTYEPKYGRKLSNDEITHIAISLADFVEHFLTFKRRQLNEAGV